MSLKNLYTSKLLFDLDSNGVGSLYNGGFLLSLEFLDNEYITFPHDGILQAYPYLMPKIKQALVDFEYFSDYNRLSLLYYLVCIASFCINQSDDQFYSPNLYQLNSKWDQRKTVVILFFLKLFILRVF